MSSIIRKIWKVFTKNMENFAKKGRTFFAKIQNNTSHLFLDPKLDPMCIQIRNDLKSRIRNALNSDTDSGKSLRSAPLGGAPF